MIERIKLEKPLAIGRRVHTTWNAERCGRILKVGPEVSEVKWDNLSRNDSHFINNKKLKVIR